MADQTSAAMPVDVWSDFVCPWCYLGKRRLEGALEQTGLGSQVEVSWHPFQLAPDAPRFGEPGAGELGKRHLMAKYGMSEEQAEQSQGQLSELAAAEGLPYRLDLARHVNTFDAHRVAMEAAGDGVGAEIVERFFAAQLCEGRRIDDPEVLVEIAESSGLQVPRVRELLAGDEHAEEVRSHTYTAQRLGANGVPFFVIDRRYGVSGAQPAETLAAALKQAFDERSG